MALLGLESCALLPTQCTLSLQLTMSSLYQGATTGGSIETRRQRPEQPIPYFTRTERINGVWDHISHHLRLKPRGMTMNPYASSPWTGFHTTFYEISETAEAIDKELWKHGKYTMKQIFLSWPVQELREASYAARNARFPIDRTLITRR